MSTIVTTVPAPIPARPNIARLSRLLGIACLITLIGAACGSEPTGSDGGSSGRPRPSAEVAPATSGSVALPGQFVSDFNEVPAIATVSYEELPEYAVFSGRIESNGYVYSFTSDIVGQGGYGDLLDQTDNETMRIQVELYRDGFNLTINPFGDPVSYFFEAA